MGDIGFFFGAGAELSYGFPNGGKFALDIFRLGSEDEKNKLKERLGEIKKNFNTNSFYLNKWFPEKFTSQNIYKFDKSDYKKIITSIMENKRDKIKSKSLILRIMV